MTFGLKTKLLMAFTLLVAVGVGNYGFLWVAEQSAARQQLWVTHTLQVISKSKALLGALRNAESGQRGFLLTRQTDYLDPYHTGVSTSRSYLQELKELTLDNPKQQSRLDLIEVEVSKKFAELEKTINLAQQDSYEKSLEIVKSNVGRDLMDGIRMAILEFETEENQLLSQRIATFKTEQERMRVLFIGEAFILVSFIIFVAIVIQRNLVTPIVRLTKSATRVGSGEDTIEVEGEGPDEIGQLVKAFNSMRREVLDRTSSLKLQALYDQSFSHVVTACTSTQNLKTALSDALIVHAAHHPSPLGAIYLYEGNTNSLRCLVTHGTSSDLRESVPADHGLIGQVYTADEPLQVGSERAEDFHIDVGLANIRPRSVILQPINYSGDRLGVLVLAYTTELTQRDQQYVANLSDQFAITIVNARKNSQLEYEVEVKNRFFSIISHDLRSPFTYLIGMTEFMSKNADNISREQLIEYAASVNKSSERVFELLHNLLEWSRLQMEGSEVDQEVIPLHDLAQESIEIYKPLAIEKSIELVNKINNLNAFADRAMAQTVIRNLIANAVKFTPLGGLVEISAAENQNTAVITVADSGIGMSEKLSQDIFRLDQKTSTTGTAGEIGTGLGLPLCKEMLELNGGSIWTESSKGKGSKFHFELPLAREH